MDYSGTTTKSITYSNDILGLAQVLVADNGTDQTRYLFGLDLIYQDDGSETRYLLADGLGSVRTELVSDTVEAVTTYSPYGNLLAQTGASGTVYGFTSEQHDGASNLLYLRARFYDPRLRVFLSRDPFPGWVKTPASLHPYSYVHNNPLNYTDPSGHDPCLTAGVGGKSLCGPPPVPDWWANAEWEYIYVDGYGVFDRKHIVRGYRSAGWIIDQIELVIAKGGGMFEDPAASFGDIEDYLVNYRISGEIATDQINDVALGIYMDFETGYEQRQFRRGFDAFSSFSPDDLPSDYIGFWLKANGYDLEDAPRILSALGSVEEYVLVLFNKFPIITGAYNQGGSISLTFPRNYEFMPMAPCISSLDLWDGLRVEWHNVPWPGWLQMSPIESGPSTWSRVE